MLASMAWKTPIVQAILTTRLNQIASFSIPQATRFDPGFRIRLRDSSAKPSRADQKYMRELERMMMVSGTTSGTDGRDTMEIFLRKLSRDSLIFDAAPYEIVPGRDGKPAAWYAIDATTIRFADTREITGLPADDDIQYVQIYDNVIINEYTGNELGYMIRNPRTSIRAHGYGLPELEVLMDTITAFLFAWQYNTNQFTQGTMQKGILNIKGNMPDAQLRAFRSLWYQQISSASNAWRTPIMNAEDVEWINIAGQNKDMEFADWTDFLIRVVCAFFATDPIEINFKYGSGQGKSMFDSGNRAKLVESKDRGLRPILRHLASSLNENIIWKINPEFSFEFVGLETTTPKEQMDLFTQRVRTIFTINEVRAEMDLAPLEDELGDIILDANWIAHKREVTAAKQAEQDRARAVAAAAAQATNLTDQAISAGGGGVGPDGPVPPNDGGGGGGGGGAPTSDPSAAPAPVPGANGNPIVAGNAGAAAQQAVPQTKGSAPGAIPGKGNEGPDKDQIAELEGLLDPKHTSSINKALGEGAPSDPRLGDRAVVTGSLGMGITFDSPPPLNPSTRHDIGEFVDTKPPQHVEPKKIDSLGAVHLGQGITDRAIDAGQAQVKREANDMRTSTKVVCIIKPLKKDDDEVP